VDKNYNELKMGGIILIEIKKSGIFFKVNKKQPARMPLAKAG